MATRANPVEIATEMGLDFTHDTTADGSYARLHFRLPPDTESKDFTGAVERVTKFRKRVKAWTIDPMPPGERGLIVAAELTFAGRFRVAAINRRNRAALVKFWSGEAMARRAALSQPTPQMGLFALREQLEKYGVKKPDEETKRLMRTLERACEVVEDDDTVVPLRPDGNLDVAEGVH